MASGDYLDSAIGYKVLRIVRFKADAECAARINDDLLS
jgi:hypothetical protein